MDLGPMGDDAATLFMVSAALAYDIIAATNSSPQTTEINAAARAETLMKWVNIGVANTAVFAAVGIAVQIQRGKPWWPIALGAGLAAALLYLQYIYARNSGLKSAAPGTETYGAH